MSRYQNVALVVVLAFGILPNVSAQAPLSTAPLDSLMEEFSEMEERRRGRSFLAFTAKYMVQNVDSALKIVLRVQDYAEGKRDTMLLITAKALHAEYFWRKGDYRKGLEYALESVDLASNHERFKPDLGKGYQTAGTIHLYLTNKDEALDYYSKAAQLYREEDNVAALCSILNNTGVIYMDAAELEDRPAFLDSALHYYKQVVELKERAKARTLLNAVGNIGAIYVLKEDWDNAEDAFDEWEELEKLNPNPTVKAMNYGSIGVMHMEQGRFNQAEKYLNEGLALAEQFEAVFEMHQYHLWIGELLTRQRNFEKAVDHLTRGWTLKDSILNVEKVNTINELEEKYEAAEKDKNLALAKIDIERKERFQSFLLIIIGIIVLLGSVAIVLLVQRFKLKKELLSQEIDNYRIRINTVFSGRIDDLNLSKEQIDKELDKPLSDREYEILSLALSDKSNAEIAKSTDVSVNTIKFHLKNAYQKLGVAGRKEAMEFVITKK